MSTDSNDFTDYIIQWHDPITNQWDDDSVFKNKDDAERALKKLQGVYFDWVYRIVLLITPNPGSQK